LLVSTGILSLSIYLKDNTSKSISINSIKDNRAMAFYIENNGEYEHANTFPTSGYKLNEEKSVCSNGAKPSVSISNSINIANLNGSTKCYLYFDKLNGLILADEIKKQSKGEYTEFTGITTEADTGVYSASDDYGTSYYFRGVENKLNNWVEFAGFYWRIIRVNGNGSIRMIYQGEATGAISSSNKTGTTTGINRTTYQYNTKWSDNTFVGYMTSKDNYEQSTSYNDAHANLYDSNAKVAIDNWYKTNIVDKGYENYIDINTGFCNDRQLDKTYLTDYAGDGYGVQTSTYAPAGRIDQEQRKTTLTPIIQCTNKERDLFTHTSASTGNKKLTYPIGLITGDELIFAGTFGGIRGSSTFYLKTNQGYWTMSPDTYSNSAAASYVFYLMPNGCFFSAPTTSTYGLRPVINLKADTKFSGSGSSTDPYVVV